jgi:hypothetical protein
MVMTRRNIQDDLQDALANNIQKEIDREIMEEIGWQIMRESNPDWHLVELKWEKGKDTEYFWNEACAWAVENFGLPGENYMTHPTRDCMKFLFKHEQHAVLMTLKWI